MQIAIMATTRFIEMLKQHQAKSDKQAESAKTNVCQEKEVLGKKI